MNKKHTLFLLFAALVILGGLTETATAQWSIGGSYEIRNEEPQNGFGVRIERELLPYAPVANVALRGHFSYFSEDNYVGSDNVTYGGITNYDYGLAAVGGVSVGLVSPYIGMGVGSSTIEINDTEDDSESNIYWNGFVGAKVSPIPYLKPFVEYRLQSAPDYEDLTTDVEMSNGRLMFGLYFTF